MQYGVWQRMIVIAAGFLLDLLLGDPHFLWHPVRGMGSLITFFEKLLRKVFRLKPEREADKTKKRVVGVLLVFLTIGATLVIYFGLLTLADRIHPYLGLGLRIVICYQMLAQKSLRTESMKVYTALKEGDVKRARNAVSMIVGRDTERLKEEGIVKAAVETVAENTSDGVIAPLLFMICFGTAGGVLYKVVNTMDSMIGYQNDTYCYLGTAAARLDDICNFIPARVSAVCMILAAGLLGMDARNGARIYRRDRYCHASPNSAQTESVCAGALGIQLAGDAWYFGVKHEKPVIGDALRTVEYEDIIRANRLLYGTSFIVLFLGLIGMGTMIKMLC